jgi:dolichol-phosphate mannosyltransferase
MFISGLLMREEMNSIELTVVVPTFNERENVAEIVRRLDKSLEGIEWEVVFVDDASPDGTAAEVRYLAQADKRVRLISRHNRRGLSSAVVEGALAGAADIIAVMDGDLQHDENTLPKLYREVQEGRAEVASASRFLSENGAAGLSSKRRHQISSNGIQLANRFFGVNMSDPLTGFFVMRRDVFQRALPRMSEIGFKVLLDIIISSNPRPRVVEVPFQFRSRLHGESKLDSRVVYDFFLFFLEQKIGKTLPISSRFISFALINSVGILAHMTVFYIVFTLGVSFGLSQFIATLLSMGFNFTINNAVTYSDRQLKGFDYYRGLFVYAALCSIGIFANVGVAMLLYKEFMSLYFLVPALAGALITVVWDFVATQAFVWGRQRLAMPKVVARAAASNQRSVPQITGTADRRP